MMKIHTFFCLMSLLCLPFGLSQANPSSAQGGIKLPQTRVIFQAKDKNATATIQNRGDNVYLVKASIQISPENSENRVPFAVTPPLFRLEPQNQQIVKIVRKNNQQLPTDRESVFYLSFLAIPSTLNEKVTPMRVSIGLQTIIKLFYRPDLLPMTQELAASQLKFSLREQLLVITNPTPYYLTLGMLKIADKNIILNSTEQMIAPFSQSHYPYPGKGSTAYWQVINDYGGMSPIHQAPIEHAQGPS